MDRDVEPSKLTVPEKASLGIQKMFDDLQLLEILPENPEQVNVGILGAGMAVEIKSLARYFEANGKQKPKITAYDISSTGKGFTELQAQEVSIELSYKIGNLTRQETFEEEQFDLIILRKPDVHSAPAIWEIIVKNGYDHLKPGGIFLVTTTEERARDVMRTELQKQGKIIHDDQINPALQTGPFFSDTDLLVARKTA